MIIYDQRENIKHDTEINPIDDNQPQWVVELPMSKFMTDDCQYLFIAMLLE
jgi:hypothetical protein